MVSNQEYEVCFVLRFIIKYENKKIFGTLFYYKSHNSYCDCDFRPVIRNSPSKLLP